MFWKKSMFTFTNGGGSPYDFNNYIEDCNIKKDGQSVGYAYGLSLYGSELTISHFAVDSKLRSKSKGEEILRELAKLINDQLPNVGTILFDLTRSTPGDNIQKLADARERLLQNVNATNVQKIQIKPDTIEVTGRWDKANW